MKRSGLRRNLFAATMTASATIVLTIVLLEEPLIDARAPTTLEEMRTVIRELVLIAGGVALLVGLVLTWVLSRAVVAPARELTAAADALARGDLTVRTRSQRDDELGEIGRALDRLGGQLSERIETLRAEESRLRTMLDGMTEAVFVTDPAGTIVLTNAALEKMVGGAARGKTATEVIRSPELRDVVQAAQQGEHAEINVEVPRADGELRYFSAAVAPLPEQAGVVAVLHDVTKQRLTDLVRRDFVANASHELRTPLTAIRGFAETLQQGAIEQPESARRFVDVILRHTRRLQALVDDLSALSRAESPEVKIALRPVDVNAAVEEVTDGLESQVRAKGLDLDIDLHRDLPAAKGDAKAVDQVLINLLDNAIKYTPEGGRIEVRTYQEDGFVLVRVGNSGPGIPQNQLKRVFERFYRVDPGRSRELGGTGLGLSIVRHLVAGMNGEIRAESQLGQWTSFTMKLQGSDELPHSDAPAERESEPAEQSA